MLNPGDRVTAEELYKILLALRLARAYTHVVGGHLGPEKLVELDAAVDAALEVFAPAKLSK